MQAVPVSAKNIASSEARSLSVAARKLRTYGFDLRSFLDVVLQKIVERVRVRDVLVEKAVVGLVAGAPKQGGDGRFALGFPKDGFFASGNMGQHIYIIPSERLVIARFGYSELPMFGINDDLSFIDTLIRATRRVR
jgi:CubicO group peptidase (beta-lactamase class C family)